MTQSEKIAREKEITIIRKAKKDNYSIINNEYVRNPNLSWKAKGLMTYLLHLPETWNINTKHLEKQAIDGRHSLKKALKELQNHGYLTHENLREKGKFSRHIWYVHEEPILKDDKNNKKPEAENQPAVNLTQLNEPTHGLKPQADFPQAVNQHLVNTKDSNPSLVPKEVTKKNKNNAVATKVAMSANADDLCSFFIEKIKERKPDFKLPDRKRWLVEIDRMLRIDNRDPKKIKAMIEWIHRDSFWSTTILSIKSLRDNFDRIELQVKGKSLQSDIQKNRDWALRNKKKYPESYKNLEITEKYATREGWGKEIPLNLPHENFKKSFVAMFGINYDDLSEMDKK